MVEAAVTTLYPFPLSITNSCMVFYPEAFRYAMGSWNLIFGILGFFSNLFIIYCLFFTPNRLPKRRKVILGLQFASDTLVGGLFQTFYGIFMINNIIVQDCEHFYVFKSMALVCEVYTMNVAFLNSLDVYHFTVNASRYQSMWSAKRFCIYLALCTIMPIYSFFVTYFLHNRIIVGFVAMGSFMAVSLATLYMYIKTYLKIKEKESSSITTDSKSSKKRSLHTAVANSSKIIFSNIFCTWFVYAVGYLIVYFLDIGDSNVRNAILKFFFSICLSTSFTNSIIYGWKVEFIRIRFLIIFPFLRKLAVKYRTENESSSTHRESCTKV